MADTSVQSESNSTDVTERSAPRRRIIRPRSTITGNAEKVEIKLEMPGVEKSNLHIDIENNELRIAGERTRPADGRYLIRERNDGDYAASYALDETIDQEKVEAELTGGVVRLTLHVKEAVKPKKISIRST